MTKLADKLRAMILAQGPMTIADYMAHCLSDPEHGYYMTRDPFGAAGDFTTAPEISQLFGELIGAWCLAMWRQIGAPESVRLVELGPGRGTLMADILRTSTLSGEFRSALNVHLVETSRHLRARQGGVLSTAGVPITWNDQLADIPDSPLILVANELFDALPVHQKIYSDGAWHERTIGIDAAGELTCGLGPPVPWPDGWNIKCTPEPGAIAESCPASAALMQEIAERIMADDGAALVIDYGYCGPAVGDYFAGRERPRTDRPAGSTGRIRSDRPCRLPGFGAGRPVAWRHSSWTS